LSWELLGFLGAWVAEQPRPVNHVTSLLEQKPLSLESPLRWHGRLRDEPAKLPWGYGLAAQAKNDDSLVLRLHYGNRNIWLPGDAEKQAERGILTENPPEMLQSDVLKVGHHGGKSWHNSGVPPRRRT